MEKLLFEMQNVEIEYDSKAVVHNVSFKLKSGEILGIVGESGSGKSTLIKAAIGLLGNEGQIIRGKIFYKEDNMLHMKPEELRKIRGSELGVVFQNYASALSPIRTIGSQLNEMIKQHTNLSKREIRDMSIELLEKMKLDGRRILESYPFELSGGMNQRVGIVMAMILKPDLLFADEPTSALDVIAQAQVIDELKKLRDEFDTAIVIATHNIGLVSYMADKVAVMYKGRLVEYGDAKEVINNPREDYTKKLIQSVPKIRKDKL